MEEDVVEVTESLPKETGLVGLDSPYGLLELTKTLAKWFEPEEPRDFSTGAFFLMVFCICKPVFCGSSLLRKGRK